MREASKPGREESARPPEDSRGKESANKEESGSRTPVGSPDNALVAVDREHGLPRGYVPGDLVPLPERGVPTVAGRDMLLCEEAAASLSGMISDARADGVELVVGSAYRSYERQLVSHASWTAVYGESEDGGFSAPPGHSEHQLGTAVDFTNASANYELGQWFGQTKASRWLRQNAARHGFVMSYPDDSRQQTGYRWEPWHYRYIGKENAERYQSSGYSAPIRFFLSEGVLPPRTDGSGVQGG